MRILGIGDECALGSIYLRLLSAGHDVRVHASDEGEHRAMDGLIEYVERWSDHLDWVRAAGPEGVIVFETADRGRDQDALRAEGFGVVGGSAFGDRLENDRAFAQRLFGELGLQTPPTFAFDDFEPAIELVRARPRRYVFKFDGSFAASWRNYVGMAPDGGDVIALLRCQRERLAGIGRSRAAFVLMDHLEGVETGIGAFFDGERFLEPACLDWEHKRFFAGDLGELTGEMGTLVTYRGSERLFARTLTRLAPALREAGHVGYVNLNTIVNEDGVWPLELTSRFGYPGTAILDALQLDGWDAILRRLVDRNGSNLETLPGYAVGVVLTVPPFPYEQGYGEISRGLPILFDADLSPEQRRRLHLVEVALAGGRLVCAGRTGQLMIANGIGDTAETARAEAYALASRIYVPNLRYRNDVASRFIEGGEARLRALGWLG